MPFNILKSLLPDRAVPVRIWRGPFRGGRVVMNPRHSLRKILGLYEHELNPWLEQALRRVARVLDVGANDGYFTFGCAAALRRMGRAGEIICFEPQARHVKDLRASVAAQGDSGIHIEIVPALVGGALWDGVTTLDAWPANDRRNTLVKIDVEGAELDVVAGATSWLEPSNLFLIEVHHEEAVGKIRETFTRQNLELECIRQRPLPFLGREQREESNQWLVSRLT
jgi:hypothetical protein